MFAPPANRASANILAGEQFALAVVAERSGDLYRKTQKRLRQNSAAAR